MSIEWKYEPRKATGYAPVGQGETADNLAAIAERLTWLCERFEREDQEAAAELGKEPSYASASAGDCCIQCRMLGAHQTWCSRLPAKEEPPCPSD